MKKFIVLMFLSFVILSSLLGDSNSETAEKKEQKSKYPYWIAAGPIPGYSDSTDWSGLAVAMVMYKTDEDDSETYPSILVPKVIYTLKNQLNLFLELNHYWKNNEWYLKANTEYKKYPDVFFEIGNGAKQGDGEEYTLENIIVWIELYKKIIGKFHAGIRYRLQKDNMLSYEPGRLLSNEELPGSRGGMSTGFGLLLKYDERDNTMMVMDGDYHRVSADFFGPFLGGNNSFGLYIIDLRKYFRLGENNSISMRVYSESLSGEPPFNFLAKYGGSLGHRGFQFGKYRDRVMVFSDVEYKHILLDWLAVTAFAGVGDVGEYWGSEMKAKIAGGLGLRIILDKDNKTNLRLDLTYGNDGLGFYLDLADCF